MKKNSQPKNSRITRLFEYGFAFITIAWLIAGVVYFYDIIQDQKLSFVATAPVQLYRESDLKNPVGIIDSTEKVKILRAVYIDGRYVYHVKTNTLQSGWILKPDDVDLKK